jgi:hypothetical protein
MYYFNLRLHATEVGHNVSTTKINKQNHGADDDDGDISGSVCSSNAVATFKAPCIHGLQCSIATASDEQRVPEISPLSSLRRCHGDNFWSL